MGYAADVKALTADIAKLTAEIGKMNDALTATGKNAGGIFSSIKGLIGGGGQKGLGASGGNRLASSFGSFSQLLKPPSSMNSTAGQGDGQGNGGAGGGTVPNGGNEPRFGGMMMGTPAANVAMGAVTVAGGVFDAAKAAVGTFYNAAPDASGVVNRAGSYYQAALRSPGLSRASLERATFSALRGGITGVGSDAQVANILANAGYAPGSNNYLAAARQVGGAANYLGMQNANAATAIAGLQGGPMAANLYQYGITTMDSTGRSKSTGEIAQQLYKIMFPSGATAKSVQESIRSGYAGLNMQGMGMSADMQQIMGQALTDIAAGKNPDLALAKAGAGNDNPFNPLFRMNTSSTMIQGAAEKNTLSGLGAAAGTIETFNNSMKDVIASMALFKGYMDGLSGNPQGAAVKGGASGLFKAGKKILGGLMVFGGGALALTGGGTIPGLALAAGGTALMTGGGTPGYGSSFGGRNMGAGKYASGLISAGYGARQAQGGNWDSTGGVHQGTDFNVASGTKVIAVKDGVVSNATLSADYGQAVVIDHEGGYSTVYAHLSSKGVSPGTRVLQGQEIGKSGKSGNASGPHLHYEVWKGPNNPVDPNELQGASMPVMGANAASMSLVTNSTLAGVVQGGDVVGGGSTSVVKGTGDKKVWATQLLAALGAPATDSNINALTTWQSREGGHWNNSASFNPLNTTYDPNNQYESMNGVGVRRYTSWETGIQATVSTLTGSKADSRGYSAIVDALRRDAGTDAVLSAVSNSAWVSGKTGQNSYGGFKGGGTPGSPGLPTQHAGPANTSSVSIVTPQSGESRVVNFNVYLHDVSDAQAMIWAKKVEEYLTNKNTVSTMGGR